MTAGAPTAPRACPREPQDKLRFPSARTGLSPPRWLPASAGTTVKGVGTTASVRPEGNQRAPGSHSRGNGGGETQPRATVIPAKAGIQGVGRRGNDGRDAYGPRSCPSIASGWASVSLSTNELLPAPLGFRLRRSDGSEGWVPACTGTTTAVHPEGNRRAPSAPLGSRLHGNDGGGGATEAPALPSPELRARREWRRPRATASEGLG